MHPHDRVLNHLAAEELLQYATKGCPVYRERNWTILEMQMAINNGTHVSAESETVRQAIR